MLSVDHISKGRSKGDEKQLPLYYPTPFFYTLAGSTKLSIILSNPNAFNWFYNNFIQLKFDERALTEQNPRCIFLDVFPMEFLQSGSIGSNLFLQTSYLNNMIINIDKNNLIEHMIRWIDHDYYIFCHVDVTKIPGTRYHGSSQPFRHTSFILGYDIQKHVLHQLDFDRDGQFTVIPVSFNDYINAFSSGAATLDNKSGSSNYQYEIYLCRVKEEIQSEIDKEWIVSQLRDFLECRSSIKSIGQFQYCKPNCVYGLAIYEKIHEYIDFRKRIRGSLVFPGFHALWEHKKVMCSRLKYLKDAGVLNVPDELLQKYASIEKTAKVLRSCAMKYNAARSVEEIDNIHTYINDIYEQEKVLVKEVIDCFV